ncbi:DUF3747 domain-containing protein [Synechococcales cyanobacterium C]|uniref:DUF3747 domain-containing protein n=1 Tax=Petrachloros mirabilis ULC683 TaxID=2781853 RepID=A0A8K1ZXI8_9CYAN|nr:DUF3747 domain-containing protein [Petrachloros mirabilis]NCJ07019.1 DUF3747 domain-containing protein [Petrachloros mirabilis ULC683]
MVNDNREPPSGALKPALGNLALTAMMIGLGIPLNPAMATTFGQQEVPQDKFIAVAVPREGGNFTLLILEQLSQQRPCWRESGSRPTRIDPLLLDFDFTGICGRSTDSNGYSLRVAGQDLAVNYRLSIQPQGNNVVLMGVPANTRQGQPMEIGRTQGIADGLLKFELDPGWRFAKRTYQGKTLGHVYLARDTPASSAVAARSTPIPPPRRANSVPSRAVEIPVPTPGTAPGRPATFAGATSTSVYRVMVRPRNQAEQDRVRALVPGAFRASYRGQTVMQVGLFREREKAREVDQILRRQNLRTLIAQEDQRVAPIATTPSSGQVNAILPVPSSPAPMGNLRGDRGNDLWAVGTVPPPPPAPSVARAPRYRVLVQATSASDQSRVRSLVPDAFRSSYQGRSVMQVGSFGQQNEANAVIALMRQNGFNPIVERSP